MAGVIAIEQASNPSPWSEASFRKEIGNPQSVFLVATQKAEVAGFAGMWLVIDEAHITTVAVAPAQRGLGIGRLLMVEILERAKALGMTCSTLEVRASNDVALGLYERLGYVRTATRKAYYPNQREDAVVMWLHGLRAWSPNR